MRKTEFVWAVGGWFVGRTSSHVMYCVDCNMYYVICHMYYCALLKSNFFQFLLYLLLYFVDK